MYLSFFLLFQFFFLLFLRSWICFLFPFAGFSFFSISYHVWFNLMDEYCFKSVKRNTSKIQAMPLNCSTQSHPAVKKLSLLVNYEPFGLMAFVGLQWNLLISSLSTNLVLVCLIAIWLLHVIGFYLKGRFHSQSRLQLKRAISDLVFRSWYLI